MRAVPMTAVLAAMTGGGVMAATLPVHADSGPVFVVPGRTPAPIVINGCDASYAVIESDFGLGKNVRIPPIIYGCRAPYTKPVGHYFPSGGRRDMRKGMRKEIPSPPS
jgi:hypothetical protein